MIDVIAAIGFMAAGASATLGVLLYLSQRSSPKTWRVGNHRVRKIEKRPHPMDDPGYRGNKAPKKPYYQCVDCEKESDARYAMKAMPCYEVIE